MSSLIPGTFAVIKLSANEAAKTYHSADDRCYFERERDVYQRLGQHPSIAALLRIRDQVIILERGQCPREIGRKQEVSDEKKRDWIAELACGLEYIHSRNVIPADLNAANAIVCKDAPNEEHAKWIDFVGSSIDGSEPLATYDSYSYRPPEPAHTEVSIETDIFAFGCTVYEIETGAPPYFNEMRAMDPGSIIPYVEKRYREVLYPSTENFRYESIITGCWHGRYRSMRDLREELALNDSRQSSAAGYPRLLLGLVSLWRVVRQRVAGFWRFLMPHWLNFSI
ncbi:hypothetical protein RBB50_005438 [Rhinocladiella similis]